MKKQITVHNWEYPSARSVCLLAFGLSLGNSAVGSNLAPPMVICILSLYMFVILGRLKNTDNKAPITVLILSKETNKYSYKNIKFVKSYYHTID